MTVSADLVALLIAKGITGDDLVEVLRAAEGAPSAAPLRSKGAERQAKYRAKLTSGVTRSDVTGDVTGDVTHPPNDNSNPPASSLRSERERAGREAAPDFRQAYPRKPGAKWQQATEKFIRLVRDGTEPGKILDGAKRFAEFRAGEDPKYTPDPVVWLNQSRWLDDFEKPPPQTRPPPGPSGGRPPKPSAVALWTEDIFDDQRHSSSAETRRPALAYRG